MRRLIAIALILWLPLQAWTAIAATGCAGHGAASQVAVQGTAASPQRHTPDASSGHEATVVTDAGQAATAVDSVDQPPCHGSEGAACCIAACTAFVGVAPAELAVAPDATASARRHVDTFASAPSRQALEPPIAAA